MSVLPAIARRMLRTASLMRLKPFDVSTAGGRAQERHRRAALTFLVSASARVVSVSTVLLSIPLCLAYLGAERFGLWMTLGSIAALLGFADLGIGNGLVNAVSEAHGKDDPQAIRRYASSGLFILTCVSVAFVLAFFIVTGAVNWAVAFNVKTAAAIVEAPQAAAAFALCFALNIPLGVVQRIQIGLQQGFVSGLWQSLGSVAGLAAVLCVIRLDGGLPLLVWAFMGPPLLASLMNGIVFFARTRPDLGFRPKDITREAMAKVIRTGLLFLVLQLALATAVYSDNLLISAVLGADAVGLYAIPSRMFALVGIAISMALAPFWPAYGEAAARGDHPWIRTTLRKSLAAAFLVSLLSAFLLVVLGGKILSVWIGPDFPVSLWLMLGLGSWSVLESTGNALAMFLNGLNVVRTQVITATLFSVVCITLKFWLLHRVGIAGVAWGNVVAYSMTVALPYLFITPRLLAFRSAARP